MILGKIHKNCKTLPLSKFIEILVEGSLSPLVIFGFATRTALQKLWDDIFHEYLSLTKNESYTHTFNTIKEYTALRNKIIIAEILLQGVVFNRNKEIISALKNIGLGYSFSETSLKDDFKKATAKLKLWIFNAEKMYKELGEQTGEGKTISRNDFDDILTELSAFQGYHLPVENLTVSEYVAVLNRFKKQIEDGKRRKNNRVN